MRQPNILLIWLAAASLVLSGCIKPLIGTPMGATVASGMPQLAAQQIPPLAGRVKHHSYQTQATFGDIASGATVSLIDTVSNLTAGSTVTSTEGNFALTQLKIVPGRIYYLEATKGLPVGGEPNRAGNPAARIRTIVQYQATTGWNSLSGPSITIDDGTTALSVILSLRSATTPRPDEAALLGSLSVPADTSPDVFTPGATNITGPEYASVLTFVNASLGTDNDPLAVITYDLASQNYYLAQKGIQVTSVTPVTGAIGTSVRIEGSNLSNTPVVRFNGITASGVSVNTIQTVVLAQVPTGATSGPLTVQVGTLVYSGTNFAVQNWDGHNVFDHAGNLYVAGHMDNAIWRFAPDGTATIVASSSVFNKPTGIALDAWDNVYVSSWNNNKIYQLRPNGQVSEYASGGGLNNPWGLAINAAGDLFVANYSGNNVLKVATGSALPITPTVYPSTGLLGPHNLAFDLAGYLYVTDWRNGSVFRIAPDGTTNTLAAGFNSPGGVALDSLGNVYVGSQDNNVYKISPSGMMSTFASLPNYEESLAFHPDGTLYVAGRGYPYIARLDNLGRVLNYYSVGHLPYSIAADGAKNLYVTSGQGWGGNSGIVSKTLWNAASGSYEPARTLIKGLPNPSALAMLPGGDLLVGDWTGLLFRANPNTGAYSTFAAGLGAIGDLAVDTTGKTYAASWGDHRVYQLMADGSRGKSWGTYYNYGMMAKGPDGAYYIPDYSWNQILRLSNGTMSVYMSYDFGNPMGIAFDSGGNMYVSSWNRNYIYKVDGSKNVSVYKSGGGLSAPGAMAFDASDNLYVTDWSNAKIRKIAPDAPKTMTDYAVIPSNPRGMARDPNTGDLYVGGWYDQTVYKVSGSNQAVTPVTTLGGTIWGLTRDAGSGDLYVACYGNSTVVRVPVSGGTNTVITANLGDPVGVLREPGKTIICRWTGSASVYEVPDGTTAWRVIGQGFWNPCGSVVDRTDDRYVYVSEWNSGTLVKLDTQLDTWTLVADSGDWSKGRNPIKGMAWGPDNMLYAQNWGGGVHRLDMNQVNRLNGNGVTFYGGNTSTMGILGGIVFGPNGVLYGTSWDWMRGSSTVVVGLPPSGLGSGVPGIAVNIWPNWVFF